MPKTPPPIPAGMREVSCEEFFALLMNEKRDIMPTVRQRTVTTWELVPFRTVWGWSAPGWANTGEHAPIYAVRL